MQPTQKAARLISIVVFDEQKGLSYKKDCMTAEKLKSNTNRFYWENSLTGE
jgi:hypothetical protein